MSDCCVWWKIANLQSKVIKLEWCNLALKVGYKNMAILRAFRTFLISIVASNKLLHVLSFAFLSMLDTHLLLAMADILVVYVVELLRYPNANLSVGEHLEIWDLRHSPNLVDGHNNICFLYMTTSIVRLYSFKKNSLN